MKEFQDKRKWKKYIYSNFTIILLIVIIVFVLFGILSAFNIRERAITRELASSATLKELSLRKENLERKVLSLNTERGLEEEIRDKFRVAKKGEKMIIILNERKEKVEKKEENYWHKFLNWF